MAYSPDAKKRGAIRDFSVVCGGKIIPVIAELIDESHIRIQTAGGDKPDGIRYLQRNTYIGEMIYNTSSETGEKKPCKLMAPFIKNI